MKFREQKLVLFYLFSDLSLLNLAIVVMALLNPLKLMGDYNVMTIFFIRQSVVDNYFDGIVEEESVPT